MDPEFAALMRGGEPRSASTRAPALFRYLFVPTLLGFSLTPWLSGSGGARAMSMSMSMSMALAGALLIVWMAEQLFPANRSWNVRLFSDGTAGLRKLARDLIYVVGITQLTSLLIRYVDPVIDSASHAVGAAHVIWPSHAPFAVRVALAFFAIELCSYWIHRAAHSLRLMWQFHSTHHVVTELNAFKSLRTHPVDNLFFHVGRVLPLMLLGAGPEELAAAIYFGAILGILSHANLELSEGALGLVVNFPRFHAVHHSADAAESHANFGCHTVIWDRIFGTFRKSIAQPGVIGVVPVQTRSLWQELAWPFYRWVSGPSAAAEPTAAEPSAP